MFPVLTFAFTSRSSAGAMPLNIEAQKKNLVFLKDCKLRSLIWSIYRAKRLRRYLSSNACNDGRSNCRNDPLQPQFILTLIAVVAISSFGVAGVGGGATFAALIVLSTMNLPIGIVALVISVEPLIDMGRTALNVSGSMTAGLISSKWLGELDQDTYNQDDTKTGEIASYERTLTKTVSVLFSSFHLPLYLLYIRHNILFQTLCKIPFFILHFISLNTEKENTLTYSLSSNIFHYLTARPFHK